MKTITDFWKKDIINKLIILVLSALSVGFLAFLYFLFTIPQGSILYDTFFHANGNIPTLISQASTATPMPTPTTAFFPSMTPLPASTSTGLSSSRLTPFAAATLILSSTPTQIQSTGTTAPTLPLVTLVSTASNSSAMACIPHEPPQTGNVVGVLDGNTIKVLLHSDGKIYVIRYIGIAVPKYGETQELYGDVAEAENYSLVFAKSVNMFSDASDKDSAGRLLRYVTVGDNFINLALIQQGLATALTVQPDTACDAVFQNAEQIARQSQVGRWVTTLTPSSP